MRLCGKEVGTLKNIVIDGEKTIVVKRFSLPRERHDERSNAHSVKYVTVNVDTGNPSVG